MARGQTEEENPPFDLGVVTKFLPFLQDFTPEDLSFYLTIAMKILSIVLDQLELYEFVFKNDYAKQLKSKFKDIAEGSKTMDYIEALRFTPHRKHSAAGVQAMNFMYSTHNADAWDLEGQNMILYDGGEAESQNTQREEQPSKTKEAGCCSKKSKSDAKDKKIPWWKFWAKKKKDKPKKKKKSFVDIIEMLLMSLIPFIIIWQLNVLVMCVASIPLTFVFWINFIKLLLRSKRNQKKEKTKEPEVK